MISFPRGPSWLQGSALGLLHFRWILHRLSHQGSMFLCVVIINLNVLWPPDEKSWVIGKNTDVGKDWEQEEKEVTEDEMVGWHHWLNGHEFEQTPGDSEGQESLACCTSWGCRVRHILVTEQKQMYNTISRTYCEQLSKSSPYHFPFEKKCMYSVSLIMWTFGN